MFPLFIHYLAWKWKKEIFEILKKGFINVQWQRWCLLRADDFDDFIQKLIDFKLATFIHIDRGHSSCLTSNIYSTFLAKKTCFQSSHSHELIGCAVWSSNHIICNPFQIDTCSLLVKLSTCFYSHFFLLNFFPFTLREWHRIVNRYI